MPVFPVVDPSTGQTLRQVTGLPPEQLGPLISRSEAAQKSWARTGFGHRAAVLRAAAVLLRAEADALALLMAEEMGKPISQGRSEALKCAWVCEHYAEHGESYLAGRAIETDARSSRVVHRPLGLVLAVMPWNFPLWQVFRFAAPALMAGNGALLKHAPNVPGCALATERILHEAGLPPDLFRALLVDHALVPQILDHDGVRAVTLTGSDRAGRAVAAQAGERLLPSLLELGGSDPFIVLEDADIEAAAEAAATSRLLNSGQSCIAAKRLIAVEAVHDRFADAIRAAMARHVMDDPRKDSTTVGPQAREDLRDALSHQVRASLEAGARCALGGRPPARSGWWFPPTLLVDVDPASPAGSEEVFGPVAAVFRVANEAEAIALANRTAYGLGAAVFTADLERGERIAAEELNAGSCFVNSFVKSDPRLPFGGIGLSGYGRELSQEGIVAFTNAKTVYVA